MTWGGVEKLTLLVNERFFAEIWPYDNFEHALTIIKPRAKKAAMRKIIIMSNCT